MLCETKAVEGTCVHTLHLCCTNFVHAPRSAFALEWEQTSVWLGLLKMDRVFNLCKWSSGSPCRASPGRVTGRQTLPPTYSDTRGNVSQKSNKVSLCSAGDSSDTRGSGSYLGSLTLLDFQQPKVISLHAVSYKENMAVLRLCAERVGLECHEKKEMEAM